MSKSSILYTSIPLVQSNSMLQIRYRSIHASMFYVIFLGLHKGSVYMYGAYLCFCINTVTVL